MQLQNDSEGDEEDGVTCLSYASRYNDASVLRCLVEARCADVTAVNLLCRIPLHNTCASVVEANEKCRYLLPRDASVVDATDCFNNPPLHYRETAYDVIIFKFKGGIRAPYPSPC